MVRVEGEKAFHMSWSAVFGGTIVALGLWMLLHVLGMAAGLTAVDATEGFSLRAIGIGTGVFSVLAPLIALFVGGIVAGRTGGILDRGTGAIHGLVLWGLSMVVGAVFAISLLSSAVRAGAGAVASGVGAVSGANPGAAAEALGLEANDLLAPVNQRLQAQGLPPLTAAQLQAATRDALGDAVRQGRLDRNVLVSSLAQKTPLARNEAEQVATRIEQQFTARFGNAGSDLRAGAAAAADKAGKAMWAVFFALLLGLFSAIAGASIGVSRRQRSAAHDLGAPVPSGPTTRTVPADARV